MKRIYCGECGLLLLRELVPAEKYFCYGIMGDRYYPHRKYNTTNGKRQYVYQFVCPAQEWAWDHHDKYLEREIVYKETK